MRNNLGLRRCLMPFASLVGVIVIAAAPSAQTAAPSAQTQIQAPEGFPNPGEPSRITMISTGSEPRTALRYHVPASYKGRMTMSTTMAMSMAIGEMAMPAMQMPVIKMTADLGVSSISPAGDIAYHFEFIDMTAEALPGGDPSVVSAIQSSAGAIKGLQGDIVITQRGITKSNNLDFSKVTDPSLKNVMSSMSTSLENLSMPLPEEAVGIGAHWEVRQGMAAGGMRSFQKVDVELTAFDGQTATLKVKTEQTAPPQPMINPMLPPGTDMSLEKMTGSGTGTMRVRFDSLVPTSEMDGQTQMLMNMSMGGDTQKMSMQMSVKMEVSPIK